MKLELNKSQKRSNRFEKKLVSNQGPSYFCLVGLFYFSFCLFVCLFVFLFVCLFVCCYFFNFLTRELR